MKKKFQNLPKPLKREIQIRFGAGVVHFNSCSGFYSRVAVSIAFRIFYLRRRKDFISRNNERLYRSRRTMREDRAVADPQESETDLSPDRERCFESTDSKKAEGVYRGGYHHGVYVEERKDL